MDYDEGMFIPIIRDIIITIFATLWAFPFILIGSFGLHAAYLGAAIAFLFCFWIHHKGLTWYIDLERDDNKISKW
jgi:hypothetical protein